MISVKYGTDVVNPTPSFMECVSFEICFISFCTFGLKYLQTWVICVRLKTKVQTQLEGTVEQIIIKIDEKINEK